MNPPYATAGDKKKNNAKTGVSDNKVKNIMTKKNIGRSKEQMYSQFIFNSIELIDNLELCFFSPSLFMTGNSFEGLREYIDERFIYQKGFIMNSSNFADVKEWTLSFSILKKK